MSTTTDILKRGTRAAQPAATAVVTGALYCVTDEGDIIEQSDGAAWVGYSPASSGTAGGLDADTDGTLAADSDSKIATQKATKTYVDNKVAGLSWKQAVRAATTAAGTLSTDFENGDAIDGVTLATGDRILIKDQATGSENGIYVVNASGAPTRASDAGTGADLVNATVYVSEGTTNADAQWTCTTNAPITVGSTALAFAQLSGGGGGSGGWTLASTTTISSPVAQVDVAGLTGTDILIICRNVTTASSGVLVLRASTDGGSTFHATSGDYVLIPTNGVESNDSFWGAFHSGNLTSARSGTVYCPAAGVSGGAKHADCITPGAGNDRMFVASTSPVNAIRVMCHVGGNLNAGTIYVFTR